MRAPLEGREEEALGLMRHGDWFGKYGRQGSMHTRFMKLTPDGKAIVYRGRYTGMKQVSLKSVIELSKGRESIIFRGKDGDMYGSDPEKFKRLSAISFSLHYEENDATYRTLDLQCLGSADAGRTPQEQFRLWFHGLGMLVRRGC